MCGRAPRDNHLMGTCLPVVSMRVTSGELYLPGSGEVREYRLEDGGILSVKAPTGLYLPDKRISAGYLVTEDHEGIATWRIDVSKNGVYASQQAKGKDWVHFLDSLGRDVSPYVHAAVARAAAVILKIPVSTPRPMEGACCTECHAFRILPGSDIVYGDRNAWVYSLSTTRLREEGLWQKEKYFCMAYYRIPEDIERLVYAANREVTRGGPQPVLHLEYAGEDCTHFLPRGTGRRGGMPAWEVPASYAGEVLVTEDGNVRTLRVRGGQWCVEVPLLRNQKGGSSDGQ